MAGHDKKKLLKVPTGIKGLDEIIGGGLPQGRTTLVCGGPGCGKTLLATEFLVRGAEQYGEPGVFMTFEETGDELATNVASLGIDLAGLIEQKKIFVDYVRIERSEIEETGEYDLEGLFIRLASAINEVGAKRVVLDTIETIFSGFADDAVLRSELRRLFRWMKDRGVTAVVTGERGEKTLTRYGLEEYVSDCVILLDNRMEDKIANRILRVVKYRGSKHGSDEYPFLIDDQGIWVEPITSLGLNYEVSNEFLSTGVSGLDEMLNGKGYLRGSSVLISGTAGTGKTSLAASMVDSACQRGERCLYFAFEESPSQIIRNMLSIGINLQPLVDKNLLQFRAARPSTYGMEMHLLMMQKLIEDFQPSIVIIDPLTNLISIGSGPEVRSMLIRLIDYLKMKQITTLFISLTPSRDSTVSTDVGISSLMDIWISVRNMESNGERNRGLFVLKARGMPHSAQVREFRMSNQGIELVEVYVGSEGVLVGSARLAEEARDKLNQLKRLEEIERRKRELAQRRKSAEDQISALQESIRTEEEQFNLILNQEAQHYNQQNENRKQMARVRVSTEPKSPKNGGAQGEED